MIKRSTNIGVDSPKLSVDPSIYRMEILGPMHCFLEKDPPVCKEHHCHPPISSPQHCMVLQPSTSKKRGLQVC